MSAKKIKEYGFFLRNFLRQPRAVGSLVPSSRALAKVMTAGLENIGQSGWVLEVGPGTGSFTSLMLEHCPDPTHYLGIDLDATFIEHLRRRFPKAKFIRDTVENVQLHAGKEVRFSAAVCSLPWTLMSGEVQEKILSTLSASMMPGATMTLFIYSHMLHSPTSRSLLKRARTHFKSLEMSAPVFRNFPPATVCKLTK